MRMKNRKDFGEHRLISWNNIILRDAEGRVIGTNSIGEDITARVQAEAETKHRVSDLETLYENGLLIGGLLEPKKIAETLVEVLEQKLDWHHVAIRQYYPENDHLELLARNQPGNWSKAQMKKQIKHLNQMVPTPN